MVVNDADRAFAVPVASTMPAASLVSPPNEPAPEIVLSTLSRSAPWMLKMLLPALSDSVTLPPPCRDTRAAGGHREPRLVARRVQGDRAVIDDHARGHRAPARQRQAGVVGDLQRAAGGDRQRRVAARPIERVGAREPKHSAEQAALDRCAVEVHMRAGGGRGDGAADVGDGDAVRIRDQQAAGPGILEQPLVDDGGKVEREGVRSRRIDDALRFVGQRGEIGGNRASARDGVVDVVEGSRNSR